MRVPHTVPENTLKAYEPSAQTLSLEGERARELRSERWDWDEGAAPSLVEECVRFFVSEFDEHKRVLPLLEEDNAILLLETLPTTLALPVVLPLIPDGVYWRRRCRDTWRSMNDVTRYGGSWKRMFSERFVEDMVESEEPGFTDWSEMTQTLQLCTPYVRRLEISQLRPPRVMESPPAPPDPCNTDDFVPEHLDLGPVLTVLSNLHELSLQFGVKDLGMGFTFKHFRLHAKDVERLAGGLRRAKNLRVLRIACSDVDDAKLNVILRALEACQSFEKLEVVHCKLTDDGAKSLGHFVTTKPSLKHLNVQNNLITADGAQGLAYAMTVDGVSLDKLDLKFNLIGDEGGRFIATALAKCRHPEYVCLAGCGLGEETGLDLVHMLKINRTLKTLDLTNNSLGEEIGYMMAKALEHNFTILKLDVRNCGFDEECENNIHQMTFRNRERVRKGGVSPSHHLAVPNNFRRGTSFVEGILVSQ